MKPKKYDIHTETDAQVESDPLAFQRRTQSALLLSLLERGLLTRSQFDRCLEEVQKTL